MTPQRPVRRWVTESTVIVASILLAFAIDAAWDVRREQASDEDGLRALIAEIDSNRDHLAGRIADGEGVRRAHLELIDQISPRPGGISSDSLAALLRTGWGYGTAEIESGALLATLARTSPSSPERRELLRLMRAYRITLDDHAEDGEQWFGLRAELIRYVNTVAPAAFVFAGYGVHQDTDFPVPLAALLSDPQLEGLVSQLAIRATQMIGTMNTLAAVGDSIRTVASSEVR